jgi:hypothetical protein
MTMNAYLQFGTAPGPFLTKRVPAKRTDTLPSKGQTVSGYGRAMPTRNMVLWAGRWRRVLVACYANAGTAYIPGENGEWIIVQEMED